MHNISIAIDGPAGAGKSTIAKIIAEKLDIIYLDTGAMYRAVALRMLIAGVDPLNKNEVIKELDNIDIDIAYKSKCQHVYLNNNDVTDKIRTEEVSQVASSVSAIPEVRMKLVEIQREMSKNRSLVMDGRDIGTFVLPNANIKFFLTASLDERAKRRWLEFKNNGKEVAIGIISEDIKKRDERDSTRSFAPLKKADDAILIDTTGKSIDQVTQEIFLYLSDAISYN